MPNKPIPVNMYATSVTKKFKPLTSVLLAVNNNGSEDT